MTTLTIVLCGAVTFMTRYLLFGPVNPERLPATIRSTLPYVMPAVLMAIIVPAVLVPDHVVGGWGWFTPYLVGALCGFGMGVIKRDSFFLVFVSAVAGFAVSRLVL
ncbi:AzlD domain-containing protein [Streptosporangium carneum]|uniref:Branched-chain amino acid transporter n=1 Tax=Streptosporangium carneum TaxID=47481 RepID=A0A9W6MFY1_9ACTN|nr:AzlD domain-containing protein [Streptosporangium carneum]GLK12746.1 hypothetical protein GCM10017600_61560 [Streptosporangium carneum]